MKTCSKCGVEKQSDDFHADRRALGGLRSACKTCVITAQSEYAKRPEVKRASSERAKRYYEKNRVSMIATVQTRRNADPAKMKRQNMLYFSSVKGRARGIWHKAKRRHKGGANTFVSFDRVLKAVETGVCERTGIPFDLEPHPSYRRHMYGPSIDKIDASGDYTEDNIVVVCNMYNFGKNQYSHDEFLAFCRAFVAHADGATES